MATTTALTELGQDDVFEMEHLPGQITGQQEDRANQQTTADHINYDASQDGRSKLRGGRALFLGLQMTLVMLTNSFTTGLITVGVSKIAVELQLDQSLVYWPVLAYSLAASPLLLPFGSIADVLGARTLSIVGCTGCAISVLAMSFSRNGAELIAFRCLQGVAAAFFLPTSMSIISSELEMGKLRNVALASLALGQVLGYAAGLVGGGVFLGTIGWRTGFYICGALQIVLSFLGLWAVPSYIGSSGGLSLSTGSRRLRSEIDWVGSAISCASIGMLSYVLAMIAEDTSSIRTPFNASLLVLSLLAVPCFGSWMRHQVKHNRPALIPNSLWKTTFISICVMIMFSYAEMQGMELLASFLLVLLLFSPGVANAYASQLSKHTGAHTAGKLSSLAPWRYRCGFYYALHGPHCAQAFDLKDSHDSFCNCRHLAFADGLH